MAAATEVKSIDHLKKEEKQKVDNLVASVWIYESGYLWDIYWWTA